MRAHWTIGGKGTHFRRGLHINIGTRWPYVWIGTVGQLIVRAIRQHEKRTKQNP